MKNNHPSPADLRALLPFVAALSARIEAANAHIESLHKSESAHIEAATFSGAGDGMPRGSTHGDKTANIALSLNSALEKELRPVVDERDACEAVKKQFDLALDAFPEPGRTVLMRHGIHREAYKCLVGAFAGANDAKAVAAAYARALETLCMRLFISREQYAAVAGFPPDDK